MKKHPSKNTHSYKDKIASDKKHPSKNTRSYKDMSGFGDPFYRRTK